MAVIGGIVTFMALIILALVITGGGMEHSELACLMRDGANCK